MHNLYVRTSFAASDSEEAAPEVPVVPAAHLLVLMVCNSTVPVVLMVCLVLMVMVCNSGKLVPVENCLLATA